MRDALWPLMRAGLFRLDLARYKQPRKLVLVPELPKNSMGKVQKTVLRERFRNAFA